MLLEALKAAKLISPPSVVARRIRKVKCIVNCGYTGGSSSSIGFSPIIEKFDACECRVSQAWQ
jgi:hypothetical protein